MSATATHFSMEPALEPTSVWVIICDATRLLIFDRERGENIKGYVLDTDSGVGNKNLIKDTGNAYIIEVLASFHDVGRPFCLINLHPTLAQELSKEGEDRDV